MRLVRFGTLVLPQLNGRFDSPVAFRSSIVALQNGGFDQDGNDSYLESKNITYSFYVSTAETLVTSIDDMVEDIYREAGQGRRRMLAVKRDGTFVSTFVKLVQARVGVEARNWADLTDLPDVAGYDVMSATFEMSYPYWLAVEDETKLLDEGWLADGSFTFAIVDGAQTVTLNTANLDDSITIDNTGNVANERLYITIEALTGVTVTGDLTITNTTTGESIQWTGSLAAGEILTIETLAQTVKVDGNNAYVDTVLPSGQIPFLSVALGENIFTIAFVSITGGNVEVTLEHSRHFIR